MKLRSFIKERGKTIKYESLKIGVAVKKRVN
jgi:hypothetical protein